MMTGLSRCLVFVVFVLLSSSCTRVYEGFGGDVVVDILFDSGIADNNLYNDFSPYELRIKAGTSVTWINKDKMTHSVNSEDSLFDSPMLSSGDKYTFTFNDPGDYQYFCRAHRWMRGRISVQ